jgi:putative nucleotidyltransferase with HDIG domain
MSSLPTTRHEHRLTEASRERAQSRLSPRERRVEALFGVGFVAVAASLLVLAGGVGPDLSWPRAAVCVVAMAAAMLVIFEVGPSYTTPLQVAFVPMLSLLPPAAVPLAAAAATFLAALPDTVSGRRPAGRLLTSFGNSWFSIGPALVFAVVDPGAPSGSEWPIYLAALGAQFTVDAAATLIRGALYGDGSLRELVPDSQWVWLIDALLAPVGLAIAFGAVDRPWLVLTTLSLAGLTMLFASERRARIDNAIELGHAYRGTALVLGNVVEVDDEYTGRHCHAVVELALKVADELGLGPAARRNVEFSALLHDVGKIAVPNEIINKTGPLNDAEWAVIRTHTIEGQRLLDQVGGFMAAIGRIVRSSHESFDGSGYPDGLKGEAIPLEARIVTCCDAFSAMTTDRPYKRARSWDDAVAELRRCAGTQFDPRVVDAALAVFGRRRGDRDDDAALLPDPSRLLPETSSLK